MQEWLQKINGTDEDAIRRIVAEVPEQWADDHIRLHITTQLRARRLMLSRIQLKISLTPDIQIRYEKTRNATEPSQIHNAPILTRPR